MHLITAVFPRNGLVVYKLEDNEKYFTVHDISVASKLEEKLLNNNNATVNVLAGKLSSYINIYIYVSVNL